ncbi:hypothetical protein IFM89_028078 [Coptis chinensis]|uniref:RNase H type-1 domain-containing protein n=1 Tax=Coptis chinensis TaxID=261450 RepID=A0A835HEX1_9MAGN|nr:hypothetical protein IFM89_028078 [Coptis chinensis]
MMGAFHDRSPLIKDIWKACAVTAMVSIWKFRNRMVYDEVKSGRFHSMVPCISKAAKYAYEQSKGNMDNTTEDLSTLHNFQLQTRTRNAPRMLECYWYLPPAGYVGGLGVAMNYEVESTAIVEGITKAIEQGWLHIWVDTDSAAAAKAFQTDNVLWKPEVNFAANQCANKGIGLNRGCKQWWNGKPPFLTQIKNPELTYFRQVHLAKFTGMFYGNQEQCLTCGTSASPLGKSNLVANEPFGIWFGSLAYHENWT